VEMAVESDRSCRSGGAPSLEIGLLGALTIRRHGVMLALPPSRKVRALFAYLSLAPRAVMRSQLCELLWDVPNDPRGELRWCLSKIRGLLDEPGRHRVYTEADTVRLDLTDCFVDAIEVVRAAREGMEAIAPERLRTLAALFAGDLLEGLEIDRSPAFNTWLTAERRRFRACHIALLERLVGRAPDDEAAGYLGKWLELAPFDLGVHELLLNALARRRQIREGEEHLVAMTRLFEAAGLDCTPIRDAWRSARAQENRSFGARAAVAGTLGTSTGDFPGGQGNGLAHDVITRLAKVRNDRTPARAELGYQARGPGGPAAPEPRPACAGHRPLGADRARRPRGDRARRRQRVPRRMAAGDLRALADLLDRLAAAGFTVALEIEGHLIIRVLAGG
jgi:DNA-binding SARP family transcriptional activator